eukprot:gene23712-29960_t
MKLMEDTRHLRCVEGLILLVNCLPTNYSKYDEILPLWIQKWDLFHNNRFWDLCWLTLLCRARKHTRTFDWVALGPYLISKLREHFKLPVELFGQMQNDNSFPFTFPGYYKCITNDDEDEIREKFAKLLYHLTTINPFYVPAVLSSITTAIDTSPGNVGGNRVVLLSGFNCLPTEHVNKSAVDIVMFLQTVRHFFHPSGEEYCTQQLSDLVASLVKEMCKQLGHLHVEKLASSETHTTAHHTLHIPTVQYLYGSLLPYILENLYSRHDYATLHCRVALKNLISVDPRVGDIAVPFLLAALDPSAVNQSHQAPIALTTLTTCFKSLLYPLPVALKYLPDILRLSLPGIDTSDSIKTFHTLEMLSTVFEYIPTSKVIPVCKERHHPLEFGVGLPGISKELADNHVRQWTTLSTYITTEWIVDVWERIFAVLEAQEALVEDPILRQSVENRVLDYLISNSLSNATKGCAKIVEHVVATNPSVFQSVVARVLTESIVSGTSSKDQLTYRLRLASGACRQAQGANIRKSMPLLESVLTSAALIHHSEKSVRTALGKLLRSVLRGVSSLYLRHKYNSFDTKMSEIGNINTMIDWFVPSSDDLLSAVSLLKLTVTRCMSEIASELSALSIIPKKLEDLISNNLHVVVRALRGVADILGDDGLLSSTTNILPTSRKTLLSELRLVSPQCAAYLESLRFEVLVFLNHFQTSLHEIAEDSPYFSLYNSSRLHGQWCELFMFVVKYRRVTREALANMIWTEKDSQPTWFAKTVYRALKQDNQCKPQSEQTQKTLSYWKYVDQKPRLMLYEARHAVNHRAQTMMLDAVHECMESERSPIRAGVDHLTALSQHKYVSIHALAVEFFENMFGIFQYSAPPIVASLITALTVPSATSDDFDGYLQLLGLEDVMAYVVESWELTVPFLDAIIVCQAAIERIEDEEKREGVISVLTDVVLQYLKVWDHVPLQVGQSAMRVVENVLRQLGQQRVRSALSDGDAALVEEVQKMSLEQELVLQDDETEEEDDDDDDPPSTIATGARFETFAAFNLLHFIGHKDVVLTTAMWQWAFDTVCDGNGHPAQQLGLCALIRMAALTSHRKECHNEDAKLLFATNNSDRWTALLTGVSRCRRFDNRDSVFGQHSFYGFDEILGSSDVLRKTIDRKFTCVTSERVMFCSYFVRENAFMYFDLACSGLLGADVFAPHSLRSLLRCSKNLPADKETERLANNATAAELFCGLLRAYYQTCDAKGSALNEDVQRVFLEFLCENLALGADYNSTWFTAVYYSHCERVSSVSDELPKYILGEFHNLLTAQAMLKTSGTDKSQSAESFVEQSKVVALTRALIQADLSAVDGTGASAIADRVLFIMSDPRSALVFHYKVVREEMSSLLVALAWQYPARGPDLSLICAKFEAISHAALTLVSDSKFSLNISGKVTAPVSETNSVDEQTSEASSEHGSVGGPTTSAEDTAKATKNAILTAIYVLEYMVRSVAQRRYQTHFVDLLSVVILSVTYGDTELVKIVTQSSGYLSNFVHFDAQDSVFLNKLISMLQSHAYHEAWRVRNIALIWITVTATNNWGMLGTDQHLICRDTLTANLVDPRPELSEIALSGMVAYLSRKNGQELAQLAAVYIRNSDILADRNQDTPSQQAAVPALVTTLARHLTTRSVNTLIVKTVQTFRMSHQDRWESDFKARFTHDQLDALQGVSSGPWAEIASSQSEAKSFPGKDSN